jgi:hypothetical protein
MFRSTRGLAAVLAGAAMLSLGACSSRQGAERSAATGRQGSAIVLSADQISGRGGALLEGLRGQVGALRVTRRTGTCPEVNFRGNRTIYGNPNAGVYVDGTQLDTCALDQIRVFDVERVEIYPSGATNRPGYRPNPHGLILVFLVGGV